MFGFRRTFLIRLLNTSLHTCCLEGHDDSTGVAKLAESAGPSSPANAKLPFPANAVMICCSIHPPNPVVPRVRNKKIARSIHRHSVGSIQHGARRWAVVATVSSNSSPAIVVIMRGEPVSILRLHCYLCPRRTGCRSSRCLSRAGNLKFALTAGPRLQRNFPLECSRQVRSHQVHPPQPL